MIVPLASRAVGGLFRGSVASLDLEVGCLGLSDD